MKPFSYQKQEPSTLLPNYGDILNSVKSVYPPQATISKPLVTVQYNQPNERPKLNVNYAAPEQQ
jgi:hypothetical protein